MPLELNKPFAATLRKGPLSRTLGCPGLGIEPEECAGLIIGPFTLLSTDPHWLRAKDEAGNDRVFNVGNWMFMSVTA